MSIEINNFSLKVEEKLLFENASAIFEGPIIIIEGCNGSGKSTFFKALLKLENKYDGEIIVDGQNISKYSKNTLRTKIFSYAPQSDQLIDVLTIRENLELICSSENRQQIYKRLKKVNIAINKYAASLSGGQRQLINVLVALNSPSKIVLLDEPFNNLSTANKNYMLLEIYESSKMVIVIDHQNFLKGKRYKVYRKEFHEIPQDAI